MKKRFRKGKARNTARAFVIILGLIFMIGAWYIPGPPKAISVDAGIWANILFFLVGIYLIWFAFKKL